MTRKLKIAMLGAGQIGRQHIQRLQRSPSCVLSAVVEAIREAARTGHTVSVPQPARAQPAFL